MAHAIEMFFDDQADAEIRRVWQLLADAGLLQPGNPDPPAPPPACITDRL